jgi:exodeoxyribonuclease-3
LKNIGYAVSPRLATNDRGVLVGSRIPVERTLEPLLSVTLPWRVAGFMLKTSPSVGILGVYVPSRDRSKAKIARKKQFIHSLLKSVHGLPEDVRQRLVIAGDYNVIGRGHVPSYRGFFPYEYAMLETLEECGFAAAHELLPNDAQPHSWIGRTGNGYLYDYFHVGTALHSRVDVCSYLHGPRLERLSDHAAVVVQCQLGP